MKKIIFAMNMNNVSLDKIHTFEDKIIEEINKDDSAEKLQVFKCEDKDSLKRISSKIKADIIILNAELCGYGTIQDTINYLKEVSTAQIIIMLNKKINDDRNFIKYLVKNGIYDFVESPWTSEAIVRHILRPTTVEMVDQYVDDKVENDYVDNDINEENKAQVKRKSYHNVIDNNNNTEDFEDEYVEEDSHIKFIDSNADKKQETHNLNTDDREVEKNNNEKTIVDKKDDLKEIKDNITNEEVETKEFKQSKQNDDLENDDKYNRILQLHLLPLTSKQCLDNINNLYKQGYKIIDANKNFSWISFYEKDALKGVEITHSSIKKLIPQEIEDKTLVDVVMSNKIFDILDKFNRIIFVAPKDDYILNRYADFINSFKDIPEIKVDLYLTKI